MKFTGAQKDLTGKLISQEEIHKCNLQGKVIIN